MIGRKDVIIFDLFKGMGVEDETIKSTLEEKIKEKRKGDVFSETPFFFFYLMASDSKEKDNGKDFSVTEKKYVDTGSIFADALLESILDNDYLTYVNNAQSITDLKAVVCLQEMNKYLSTKAKEIQFTEEEDFSNYDELKNLIKEPTAEMLMIGYDYFNKQNFNKLIDKILIKGISLDVEKFWPLIVDRFEKVTHSSESNDQILNNILNLFNELEKQNLSSEKIEQIKIFKGEIYEHMHKWEEASEEYINLLESKPDELKYWKHLRKIMQSLLDEQQYKFIYETLEKVLENVDTKDEILYYIKIMQGYSSQNLKDNQKAMRLYSQAIEIFPNKPEAWKLKLVVMMDKDSEYYNPPFFTKVKKMLKLAKANGVDLADLTDELLKMAKDNDVDLNNLTNQLKKDGIELSRKQRGVE